MGYLTLWTTYWSRNKQKTTLEIQKGFELIGFAIKKGDTGDIHNIGFIIW